MNYKETILENAIASALTNAENYPKALRPHVLGSDLRKPLAAVKEAVVGTGLVIVDADYMLAHEQVTRVELIDNSGRAYVKYGVGDVVTALQDNGRTLKLFLRST